MSLLLFHQNPKSFMHNMRDNVWVCANKIIFFAKWLQKALNIAPVIWTTFIGLFLIDILQNIFFCIIKKLINLRHSRSVKKIEKPLFTWLWNSKTTHLCTLCSVFPECFVPRQQCCIPVSWNGDCSEWKHRSQVSSHTSFREREPVVTLWWSKLYFTLIQVWRNHIWQEC